MLNFSEKSMMAYITWHVLLFPSCSFATASGGNACFNDQELRFFCDYKEFEAAKTFCEKEDSFLVKIDSADMAEVINHLIDGVKCPYKQDIFIGAKVNAQFDVSKNKTIRTWKWLDGSNIALTGDNVTEYQNWKSGQPNNHGGREDCLLIDKHEKQWKDSPCYGNPLEEKHFICQKKVTMEINVSSAQNERRCGASAGFCVPHAEWQQGSAVVSTNSSHTVYQNISLGSSLLYHENATIGDAGEYICVARLGNVVVKAPVMIYVNGTPEIINISPFACNTSLQILWKPHSRALGFRHRIIATAFHNDNVVKIAEEAPTESVPRFSVIDGLEPSTEYSVKAVACNDKHNCSDKHSTIKTATTLGKIVEVMNATIKETNTTGNDTCTVTWHWLYNIPATFQINVHPNPKAIPEVKNVIGGLTNYSFEPTYEQVYKVEILPVLESDKYCPKPVKAVGSCVGKKRETLTEEENKDKHANVMMIIIPSAAVSGVVLLAIVIFASWKRIKAPRHPSEGMTTNPIYDTTDYEHLHSSSKQKKIGAEERCSTTMNEDADDVAYATATDLQSSSGAPIYATVDKLNRKAVGKEESGGETKITKVNKQGTEEMVVNPIYDMEPSTSTASHDQPATPRESDAQKFAGTSAQAASVTDDPIYSAVDKVKKKKKKKCDEKNFGHD